MEVVRLKHGDLDVELLFCNKAQRSAAVDFENEFGKMFEGEIGLSHYALLYIYHAYRCHCVKYRNKQELDSFDFDEALTNPNVPKSESNLSEVMEQIGNTMVSTLQKELQVAEKEEKKTKMKSGINSKPISVAN